jgi:hypothetical protein
MAIKNHVFGMSVKSLNRPKPIRASRGRSQRISSIYGRSARAGRASDRP